MLRASTGSCLMASRGGGALAQHGLPARDTQARLCPCASSAGTYQRKCSLIDETLIIYNDTDKGTVQCNAGMKGD